MTEQLSIHLQRTGVIAVLMIDRADDAVPLARALLAGGVDCIELTLRTDAALESLRRIRAEVPEMTVGVGTILTPQQAHDARDAGASFGVAPGMNPRVVAEAKRIGLPFAPGICTPTDIELAVEAGCRVLKFFPSEPSGGLAYLRWLTNYFAGDVVRVIAAYNAGEGAVDRYSGLPPYEETRMYVRRVLDLAGLSRLAQPAVAKR